MRWRNCVRRSVKRKEIIPVGNKRAGGSTPEVGQTLRDTEAVKIICINLDFFFCRGTYVPQKIGRWEEEPRHEFREEDGRGCWRCRGEGEKGSSQERWGAKNLVLI